MISYFELICRLILACICGVAIGIERAIQDLKKQA